MDVSNVGKPLLIPVAFRNIEELTLERDPMHVSNVGKHMLLPVCFVIMK
jgi:hypothetical protein